MSLFSKPTVGVAFASGDAPNEVTVEPSQALWAHDHARRVTAGVLLALLCIGIAAVPIAIGGFLPVDTQVVTHNPAFYSFWGLKQIWLSPQNMQLVSPMANTLLLCERQLFNDHATGYRLTSMALHIATTLLLLRLLSRLELPGAWLGAALFALHPVQVDTVCWISQQRYLTCGVFFLGTLLVYLRRVGLNPTPPPPAPGTEPLIRVALPESATGLYVLAMLLFVLALLSHVIAATFPLIVLIMIWWERGEVTKADLKPLILPTVLGAAFIGVLVRIAVGHNNNSGIWTTFAGWRWIIYVGRGAWTALLAIVLPITLSFAHRRMDVPVPGSWQLIFPLAAVFVIVAFWLLRHRWGRGPAAAALLFCTLLLPAAFGVDDASVQDGITLSEHAMYFAVAAVVVPLAALIMEWLLTNRRGATWLAQPGVVPTSAIVLGLILAAASAFHAAAYSSPMTVWQQVLRSDGDAVLALNSLGMLELDDLNYNKAESHFRDALLADPTQTTSLFHLADIASRQKDYARAVGLYYKILKIQPDNWDAHLQLADAYSVQGETSEAIAEYQGLLRIKPNSATVYNQLGLIYSRQGEPDKAEDAYKKAIEYDPKSGVAYLNLANLQFQLGRYVDAKNSLESVIKIDPSNFIAWLNAGVMATTVGDLESGERYFRVAMYYNVKNVDACVDLGKVLMRLSAVPGKKSRVDEAIAYFKRALSLDPGNQDATANLADAQKRRDQEIRQRSR